MVAANAAVAEYFKADIGEYDNKSHRADKAEDLTCIGKNEVVVYLGNSDIIVRLAEKCLAEDSAGLQSRKT